MEEYQTIAIFTYPSEYAILRLELQAQNIRFVFQNETVVGVLPFHSNAFGGIRLQVHPQDIDRAKEILEDFNRNNRLRIV